MQKFGVILIVARIGRTRKCRVDNMKNLNQ